MSALDFFEELSGFALEDLHVGMQATVSRTITETDLRNFSGVSGDTNPMHLNEEYASHTRFKRCIVHGMLTASLISAVIGTRLPGPGCIYLSQTLNFKAPVFVGETVYAVAKVIQVIAEKSQVVLDTQCIVNGKTVLQGEARILVRSKLDKAA